MLALDPKNVLFVFVLQTVQSAASLQRERKTDWDPSGQCTAQDSKDCVKAPRESLLQVSLRQQPVPSNTVEAADRLPGDARVGAHGSASQQAATAKAGLPGRAAKEMREAQSAEGGPTNASWPFAGEGLMQLEASLTRQQPPGIATDMDVNLSSPAVEREANGRMQAAMAMAQAKLELIRPGEAIWVAILAALVIVVAAAFVGYLWFLDDNEHPKWWHSEGMVGSSRAAGLNRPVDMMPSEQILPPRDAKYDTARKLEAEPFGIGGGVQGKQQGTSPYGMRGGGQFSSGRALGSYGAGPPSDNALIPRYPPGGGFSQPGTGAFAGTDARASVEAESGLGTNTPNQLCPGLVVPHGNECILAVRATRIGSPPPSMMLDIMDLQGKPVLKADMRPGQRSAARLGGAPSSSPPVITLRTTSPIEPAPGRPDPGDGNVLGICRLGDTVRGRGTMYIHNGEGDLFGALVRDGGIGRESRWVFTATHGSPKLIFEGSYFERAITITDENQEVAADTEPWSASFDSKGHYCKLRVVSEVDVGLILCGLLSIERLETMT